MSKYEVEKVHHEDRGSVDFEKSVHEIQIEHVPEGTASAGKALFMLLKAFIGTGVIFLPNSFKNGGLALSIVLMVVLGAICLVAFQLLVYVQRQLGGTYGQVAEKLYGRWSRYMIDFFLVISQMGFVASYMIFISNNLNLVVEALSYCNAPFEGKYYIWIVLAAIIPLCWVRKIARLGILAIIADIFIGFGLICVIYYTSAQITHHGVGPNIIARNPNDFGLMIGTAVFSYEGIGMIVPIIEGMKEPEKFPMVLNIGMGIVTTVCTLIGILGYVAYGENIEASVVSNFPAEPLAVTVQLLYATAMILTSPFMLWPPIKIIEQGIFGSNRSGIISLKWKWLKNFVRSLIPIVCAAVSFGVGADNLDKFVSLVGIVACMPLCFIFPGMFHLKVTTNKWLIIIDWILILWGLGIIGYTMYVNINSWIVAGESAPVEHICRALQPQSSV